MAAPILLVEDDLALAQAMDALLERAGLTVEHCSSGAGAIELLRVKSYPLIVLDLILGDGPSGIYVVDAVREISPERRPAIILVTGASLEAMRGLNRALVSAVIFKPVDFPLFTEYALTAYRASLARQAPLVSSSLHIARTFCGHCGSEIQPWVPHSSLLLDLLTPDETFQSWLDTPCLHCGSAPRTSGGRSELAR